MLKLYDYFRSSACYRVRIALNLKRLTHEVIPIHLVNNNGEQFSARYSQINPQNLVPTLQNGTELITQSLAIIEYLEEVHPEPPLLPSNAYTRALVRAFALNIIADIHPLNNLRVLKYLTSDLNITEGQKNQWYQHWIKLGLTALEARLQSLQNPDDFCFGNTPTIADVCLVPQLLNARRFNCDLSAYPTLVRIDANCRSLAAFQQAAPKEIPA